MRPSRSRLMARRAATSPPLPVGPDAATVQAALLRIAEAASAARDLDAFYATIHGIVGELMAAENFYIALVDTERGRMNYPYYVDDVDDDPPDPAVWYPFGEGQARGITAYALRRNEPLLIEYPFFQELIARGEVELLGVANPESTWVGVPLVADGRQLGIVVVQSYTAAVHYTKSDLDLLVFVAQHVANALVRARAIEETRERNAELAIINEVRSASPSSSTCSRCTTWSGTGASIFARRPPHRDPYDAGQTTRSCCGTSDGVRLPNITEPMHLGAGKRLVEAREPLLRSRHDWRSGRGPRRKYGVS